MDAVRALQGYSFEWIVVDDGSTDETATMVEATRETIPGCRLIRQPAAGVATARNRGLDEATGTYVWFVDADDWFDAKAVAALFAAVDVAAPQPDVLMFQAERVWPDGTAPNAPRLLNQHAKPFAPMTGDEWVQLLITQKEWRHYLWQHWYRRAHLARQSLRFADGLLHEDIAFVTEAAVSAAQVRYMDANVYRYRLHAASVTGSTAPARVMARLNSYFTVVEQLADITRRAALSPQTRRLLDGEVVGQALQVFELAKSLPVAEQQAVCAQCRTRRFAQSLWPHAHNWKRMRQVATMWLKQQGWIAPGASSATVPRT